MNLTESQQQLKAFMINMAYEHLKQYPQYAGHFDNYVLVQMKKDIKSKLGTSHLKNEIAIAAPIVRVETRHGRSYRYYIVYSPAHKIDTMVRCSSVIVLELVNMTVRPL